MHSAKKKEGHNEIQEYQKEKDGIVKHNTFLTVGKEGLIFMFH